MRCACASRRTCAASSASPRDGTADAKGAHRLVRLRILSDLHLEIWPFELPPVDADLVVLAGDIANGAEGIEWARRAFDVPGIYVPGKHDPHDREQRATHEGTRAAPPAA